MSPVQLCHAVAQTMVDAPRDVSGSVFNF